MTTKWTCPYCKRSKFQRAFEPHRCSGGFRKSFPRTQTTRVPPYTAALGAPLMSFATLCELTDTLTTAERDLLDAIAGRLPGEGRITVLGSESARMLLAIREYVLRQSKKSTRAALAKASGVEEERR